MDDPVVEYYDLIHKIDCEIRLMEVCADIENIV